MKKLFFILTFLYLCVLTSCAGKDVDPYQAYRGKTSIELFTAGEKALAKKNYSEAVKNFEALDAIYPFGPHAQQAQLDVIYVYYKNGDIASAIVAADRYIRLYPRGRHVDYAYYMRGIVGFDLGLSWVQKLAGVNPASRDISTLQQSYRAFATLVDTFPQSPYVPDALTRMKYIRNLMAQREIMIAQFYLKRHAYVAAANRATYVVQHFQGSPEVIKGLAIMVQAYRALDLPKMADSSYQLLKINYPNSPELRKLPPG
ncbi:outer membrane protein assembly factor BamD [Candidatus Coxiella mudrowiae]|uniref:outer membrane protein assembly factor BamD n=1 Tax=Candidatus Coxiella mudrowiae TaxID=2054173 RepID=UPI000C2835F0|nr:outer membrane protein assembly factor BamD [Candidatus Coxiella mudrowiae]